MLKLSTNGTLRLFKSRNGEDRVSSLTTVIVVQHVQKVGYLTAGVAPDYFRYPESSPLPGVKNNVTCVVSVHSKPFSY